MSRRIGLLGGTFDPFHRGHLDLGAAAEAALDFTTLIVLPSHVPPHRPAPLASPYHRFAMAALAIAGLEGWMVSDRELLDARQSYTSQTLRALRDEGFDARELFFVIGADAFADIEKWRDYPDLLALANFAVVSRPAHPVDGLAARLPRLASRFVAPDAVREHHSGTLIILIEAPTADVSATIIRNRLADGLPVDGMLTPQVLQHIEQHRLYRSPGPDRRTGDRVHLPGAGRLHGKD